MTAPALHAGSHYAALAALPLVVEGYGAECAELDVSSGFRRVTTTVVLHGGGYEGRGEDVAYVAEDHDGFPLALPLAGSWTIDAFSAAVGGLDLFPGGGPTLAGQETYRRWAFESAALDLALRQAGLSLGAALGLRYRPLCFVVSTRLDITPWLAVDPALEFKLDPTSEWDAATMARIAATGRVQVLDFKAFYEGTPVDNAPDPRLYAAAARAFPDAVLEDPVLEGPARAALRGHEARFSFDAPIHAWADVEAVARRVAAVGPRAAGAGVRSRAHAAALPVAARAAATAAAPQAQVGVALPRFLNIKPSRFGTLRALFDCVARAQGAGITLYGGGQFELGVGREQIQALASLLYPDGPNDVAPRDFHGEARPGVPRSPLVPLEQEAGFGFAFAG